MGLSLNAIRRSDMLVLSWSASLMTLPPTYLQNPFLCVHMSRYCSVSDPCGQYSVSRFSGLDIASKVNCSWSSKCPIEVCCPCPSVLVFPMSCSKAAIVVTSFSDSDMSLITSKFCMVIAAHSSEWASNPPGKE